MFQGKVEDLRSYEVREDNDFTDFGLVQQATSILMDAKNPGIYVGWGAKGATDEIVALSEKLVAPVATTLQGISSFPANHPNHVGVGFGNSALPAGKNAFKHCDCLLAVGVRFGEIATGSYGISVPANLVHIDINKEVFNKNYPAKVAIEGDAKSVCQQLLVNINGRSWEPKRSPAQLRDSISMHKGKYFSTWRKSRKDNIVSPGYFFESLRPALKDDAIMVVDDGKHTFLSAELFPVYKSKHFISPTDFNCMGYCVPAAIGAKLSNPDKEVVGIAGDGAFLMTGMELLTASTYGIGLVIFVFNDGELGQISQFQKIPLNKKTCTVLGKVRIEGIATATGAHYLPLNNDYEIDGIIKQALQLSFENKPVIVDVKIDYSKKTMLTKGVVKTNLSRFSMSEKVRFISRAIKRHTIG
jgi:acetolactate synthase-1/2/3 large subunit